MTANGTLPMERNAVISAPLLRMYCCPRCDGIPDQVLSLAREAVQRSQADLEQQLADWAEGQKGLPFIDSLTVTERKLFEPLWLRRGTPVDFETLHRALYGHGIGMNADRHRIRVFISRVRAKTEPLGYHVESIMGYGLRMARWPGQGDV
jgi:DNA-binding response OmpR family regulator